MEKEKIMMLEEEEEEVILIAPYYIITYIDDDNRTHMAMIKDNAYVNYLKDRFIIKECKLIVD